MTWKDGKSARGKKEGQGKAKRKRRGERREERGNY